MNFASILNQPYPQIENRWKIIFSISCFISLFILVFQPFQLSQMPGTFKEIKLTGYGAVTYIALIINMIVIPDLFKELFKEQTWTVKKQIAYFTWITFTIGFGNFFYTLLITDYFQINLSGILLFQAYTTAIGILPVSFLVMFTQYRYYKRYSKSASETNLLLQPTIKPAETEITEYPIELKDNGKIKISIRPSELLYMEAMGNYVKVFCLKNNTIEKITLRSSLKEMLACFKGTACIIKCHRTYIVNLQKINKTEGNAQGYLLSIEGTETKIPVSRTFIPVFKQVLEKVKKEAAFAD